MLFLISVDNPDQKYVILGGHVYLLGRRDCDILIPSDATVSRKHAELSVSHAEVNLNNITKFPILKLKDVSKFGSWVNNQRVSGERILQDGDTVYFGSPKSSFMVVYEPFVVTTSCLDSAAKKSVRHDLSVLGGHVLAEWQKDCSFLVMSKISVTIKVICALVSQKYVVTPHYLEQYIKYLQGSGEKPDPARYIPCLAETQLDPDDVSFSPDERRKTLFKGMTFYFWTDKQLKKMSLAIELAGGIPLLLPKGKADKAILKPGCVVMNCTDTELLQSSDGWVTNVQSLLERHNKHMILDAEIGYAVLYCSVEKHCNPDFLGDENISKLPSQSLSQMEPFVANTETQSSQAGMTSRKKRAAESSEAVDETKLGEEETKSQASRNTQKHRQSRQQEMSPVQTIVKEEKMSQPHSAQKKRRRDDDQEEVDGFSVKKVKSEPVTPSKSSSAAASNQPSTSTSGHIKSRAAKINVIEDWDSDEGIDYSSIDLDTPQKMLDKSKASDRDSNQNRNGKSRSRSKSPPQKNKTAKSQMKSPVPTMATVKTETSSVSRSSRKLGASEIHGKVETVRKELENTETVVKKERDVWLEDEPKVGQGPVPSGFLTTRKPIKGQVGRNLEYMVDNDLPTSCIHVEEACLVARHPQTKTNPAGDCPKGFTRWKGKIVRNFKKFKKTSNCGSQGLPNIIGGSALEVHVAKRSKEIDDWFKDSVQAESQHNAEDRRAQELFDFDPGSKRRGR